MKHAKQSNTGRWSIAGTTFCKSDASVMRSAYSASFDQIIASVAVSAWLHCVELSNENKLFMEYEVSNDGRGFTGILRTTASTGSLQRSITGIVVSGAGSDSVACNIGGTRYFPRSVARNPVMVQSTGTAIACNKTADSEIKISLQLQEGATPFVTLPSPSDISASRFGALKQEIADLATQSETASKEVRANITSMQSKVLDLAAAVGHLEPLSLYQCPVSTDLPVGGDWASFGCIGQMSAQPACQNLVWSKGKVLSKALQCTPVKLFRQK